MTARRLAVSVVVERTDGRLLFIERARKKFAAGYWTPVTGAVEPGESLEEAARREVLEEVGLEVEVGRELGRTGVDAPPGQQAPPFDLVWFAARAIRNADELRLQDAEVAQARWVTLAEALTLEPMFETTRSFMRSTREFS